MPPTGCRHCQATCGPGPTCCCPGALSLATAWSERVSWPCCWAESCWASRFHCWSSNFLRKLSKGKAQSEIRKHVRAQTHTQVHTCAHIFRNLRERDALAYPSVHGMGCLDSAQCLPRLINWSLDSLLFPLTPYLRGDHQEFLYCTHCVVCVCLSSCVMDRIGVSQFMRPLPPT